MAKKSPTSFLSGAVLIDAIIGSFKKLNPASLIRNPVMFTVGVASGTSTLLTLRDALTGQPFAFGLQISLWLWFTVL
ncbi:MAG: potassium-transporting ATPase subunit B, partial [Alphaproteobacteria bacterium]|nr:potassium-transporting ATPase subunit B [Alphaproteobacteria bacterium]